MQPRKIPDHARLNKDICESLMDLWRARMHLLRWIKQCGLRRMSVFNNFKADELVRYKQIILPLAVTRKLKDCLRYWRIKSVRDKRRKNRYFYFWRKRTAVQMVSMPDMLQRGSHSTHSSPQRCRSVAALGSNAFLSLSRGG